ncbi:hypothetical protein COLO4_26701 [Corchorus olitorius]|uniref:Uncharacterized protein n=1 Tax=Corchorus olitorius TaxID=93759 RepID=A0A1R3HV12_9ROSI|nr:hypothetical protein COLO4_26701 [Corchorus olitorius]
MVMNGDPHLYKIPSSERQKSLIRWPREAPFPHIKDYHGIQKKRQ